MKKRKRSAKRLVSTLLATLYTIPIPGAVAAMADQEIREQRGARELGPRASVVAQAVKQEVIQLIRRGETDEIMFNIAGQPGVHFRIYYSSIDKEESYRLLPKGQGVIGENGMASISFELKELGKGDIYLRVRTSDTADFSREVRTMPTPLVIESEDGRITVRGLRQERRVPHETAVAGVRG